MYNKQEYILIKTLKSTGLYDELKNCHTIIAGGAIRSVFANEIISDFDIYFKTNNDLLIFLKRMLELDIQSKYTTALAKTFIANDMRVQLITISDLICENPKNIIEQFDYSVCMGAYDLDTQEFTLNENFLEHIARRELYYNIKGKYPLASLFRLRKYFKKGYTISGTEIIKLGLSINNLNIKDYRELKQQLEGIDTLFLEQLTNKLLTSEYANKKYDFNEFLNLVDEYYQDKLEEFLK
jgi:hypothetical protein